MEEDYQNFIVSNLDVIEPGLRLYAEQFHLPNHYGSRGFIDILCIDKFKNFVVIEIKNSGSAARNAPFEIVKYVSLLCMNHGLTSGRIRCIVISSIWDQLLVSLSKIRKTVDFPILGINFVLSNDRKIIVNEKIEWVDVESSSLPSFYEKYYLADFKSFEDRDQYVKAALEYFQYLDIGSYVILPLTKTHPDVEYAYRLCVAVAKIDEIREVEITKRLNHKRVLDNDEFYLNVNERLIESIMEEAPTVDYDLRSGTPEAIARVLDEWDPDGAIRGPNLANALTLSEDSDIAFELAKIENGNKFVYNRIIDVNHKAQLIESYSNIQRVLSTIPPWAEIYVKLLEEFSKTAGSLAIRIFSPQSIIVGLYGKFTHNLDKGLPNAEIFSLDSRRIRRVFGILEWNGIDVRDESADAFISFVASAQGTFGFFQPVAFSKAIEALSMINLQLTVIEQERTQLGNILRRIQLDSRRIIRKNIEAEIYTIDDLIAKNKDFAYKMAEVMNKTYIRL
jgi:hypothetical protein